MSINWLLGGDSQELLPNSISSFRSICIVFSAAFILLACTRPESMHVDKVGDPVHADEDVAFRTTYYFRVFDACAVRRHYDENAKQITPYNDTLYRFRMTGKASTLLSNIRFESGSLLADQIDPFGATVTYDKEIGRFRFQSREDLEVEVRRHQALESYERIFKLYESIRGKDANNKDDPNLDRLRVEVADTLKAFIAHYREQTIGNTSDNDKQNLQTILTSTLIAETPVFNNDKKQISVPFSIQEPASESRYEFKIDVTDPDKPKVELKQKGGQKMLAVSPALPVQCPDDGSVLSRRGFQILGPEGWRTFDQDERLLMVMSADSEPLISSLKELSQRLINSRSSTLAFERVLPTERLRVSNAQLTLTRSTPTDTPKSLVDQVVETFKTK